MDHYSIFEPPSPNKEPRVAPEENPVVESGVPLPAEDLLLEPVTPASGNLKNTGLDEPSVSLPGAGAPPQAPAGDLDAALQTLVQKAQYISNAHGAAIALRQGADVICRAAAGNSAPDRGARLQLKSGLTAECLRGGELLRCDNAMLDPRVDLESCKRLGIESIIIAPIHSKGSLIGVLELFSAHAYSFQERDVETVKALAQEIGNLLEEGEAPLLPPAPEAPAPAQAAPASNACVSCGSQIARDAVFCTACGSFQEDKPAGHGEEAAGWKARLSSRRLLVPAVFVGMALLVAVAPVPRRGSAAPATLRAAAAPAPVPPRAMAPAKTEAPPPAAKNEAKSAPRTDTGTPAAPAGNPTIANSVKELLGGVSSDFSKLLPVNEKAEPPSNGDPNLKVWVDTRKGYYYCPGDEQYGRTGRGSYMTQKEAEANYYIPALIKPCM